VKEEGDTFCFDTEREKDFFSRRSWIGGEGISSRDQYRSGRRENRGNHKWVSTDWSHNNRVMSYGVFVQSLCVHVHGFQWRKHVYMGFLKERHVHLRKVKVWGRTTGGVARVCRCCL
jgi:hypothetical protein